MLRRPRVPVRGPLWQLALLCLISSVSFSTLGILVASRVRTMEAASGLMNFVMLPMWICSGVFFSASHFPDKLQPLISALPLTALNDGLRAIAVDGASLGGVARPLAVLAAWGVTSFVVGLRIFRWG